MITLMLLLTIALIGGGVLAGGLGTIAFLFLPVIDIALAIAVLRKLFRRKK